MNENTKIVDATHPAGSKSAHTVKDLRRQQLLDAAADCIYRYGLENTTVAKVTGVAGLSAGTVNFYFDSKSRLFTALLAEIRDEFSCALFDEISPAHPPEENLKRLVSVHFDEAICSAEKVAVWHAFASARHHREEYQAICGEFDRKLDRLIGKQFTRLCDAPEHAHYQPETLALGLTGLLDSLWQGLLYDPETFDRKEAERKSIGYLSSLFPAAFDSKSLKSGRKSQLIETGNLSELLPAWTYDSPEFLDLEIETLFKTHWMLVGHVSQVDQPRSYMTFDSFGERALIIRGDDGELRAFHNVCRHRGASLLEGNGTCRNAISCPFHGWTYDLAGNLVTIPHEDTFDRINRADHGLVPLEMEVWMGLVFIRFAHGDIQGAKSMKEIMAPVEARVAPYRIEEMRLLPGSEYRELRPYNWKVIHDIDNEGYHVPMGHPALQQLYGGGYTDFTVDSIPVSTGYLNDRPGKFWSVRHYKQLLPAFDHLPEDNQRLWLYTGIFPNAVVGLYPESVEFYMTIPHSVNQTWYRGARFGLPDERRETRAARFLNRRINDETEAEDESFVRGLQNGRRSSAFPEQQLSSLEQGVRSFHKAIQSALPVATLADQPAPGTTAALNQTMGD